jgi:hypothetical protein
MKILSSFKFKIISSILLSYVSTATLCFAATLDGVTLPDTAQVGKTQLTLNGMGTRKATFFKVKVYVAGLYLETQSQNPQEILDSKKTKKLVMSFVHDVPASKLSDTWKESFESHCKPDCEAMKPSLQKLSSMMQEMKTGDKMQFTFLPQGLEVHVKGEPPQKIESAQFQRFLLSIWLGSNPPNEDLKKGLLGLLPR